MGMRILVVDDEPMSLEETKEVTRKVKPEAEIVSAGNYKKALEAAKEDRLDIALLDIEMPGMNGLELAKRLKEICPDINIIFVTAYEEYALEAFSVYASGYLMKPVMPESMEEAFKNLRNSLQDKAHKLKVQCFGKFEVFYEGKPLQFSRAKAKEIFAYLIDLKGASANTGELCAVLWEDSKEIEKNRHYFRNLISDLKKTLRECNAEDVFICERNSFAIDTDKVKCDYYEMLKQDVPVENSYCEEYMKQYSWAEFSVKHIDNNL